MATVDNSRRREDKPHKRRSVLISPAMKFSPPGSRFGGFNLAYSTLRAIAKKSPTVAAIIALRCNQVAVFAKLPRHKGDRGFEVVLADDPGKKDDLRHNRVMASLEQFLLNCGWKEDPMRRRHDFAGWLSEILTDMLILNAPATELVYDESGKLSEMWGVDGATIELQWSERYIPTTRYGRDLDQPVAYVQVVDGQIQTEYAADELIYCPINPVTDIEMGGYGVSPTEYAIDWIAAEILCLQYNSNYFDHGSVPPGILSVIGNYSDETVEELNVMWETDVKGVVGQHKPVILVSSDGKDVKWIDMKQSNRDMEMGDFLDKLGTKICSIFSTDPIEIGQRSASNTGGMSASENTEAKIDLSQDKGLLPIMSWLERMINRYIMPALAPGYAFRWTGINTEDENKKTDILNKQGKEGGITYREWRLGQGMDESPPGVDKKARWLDAPMNVNALQVWMQENGMQPTGQPGELGEEEPGKTGQLSKKSDVGNNPNKPKSKPDIKDREVAKSWRPLDLEALTGPYR